MLHTKFHQNLPSGSWKEDFFKCFYHLIWAWQPSWSCDLQNVDEVSLTCTYKLTFKNLVENGPVVSEKRKKFNLHLKVTLCQGQEMTFLFNTHISSLNQLV